MRRSPIVAVARVVTAVLLLAASPARAGAAPPSPVEFAAPDGLMLQGTYWAAAGAGPAVLLLHQCNADKDSWAPLAGALAAAGVHVLAFDFRGFGGSRNEAVDASPEESRWSSCPDDVDRAVEFLRGMPDVDGARLGVMGASCGGSQALLLALRDPEVKAVGFLSSSLPRLGDVDVAQFQANRTLPVLAIAAEKDKGSYERAQALFAGSADPRTKLVLYKGALHGVPLFEHDPGLVASIVAWFTAAL